MSAKMARSALQPPFRVPRLRPVVRTAGSLVRKRRKRKNSTRVGVHMGNPSYSWSKEFLEAGKRRLSGDTARVRLNDEGKGKTDGSDIALDGGCGASGGETPWSPMGSPEPCRNATVAMASRVHPRNVE